MIVHIALFKWKVGTSEEKIENILADVKALKKGRVGIQDILVGKNYHKEAKGFTHGVVVLAENQEVLDGYRKHPQHGEIVKDIEEIEEDSLGFDFKN
ncbi:MAG: stress protein [Candidatus Harrisonbacteria bacterium CG10_big_fil_rev_8_21_14_0_10_45_28]|uniref:Stress protein n=1 Tax=Candidatus Harrisonbacteria bacterium CG10_big_fil_rev_8_21_14_0_10_45_28 TaxID=1974586 RepID=A0A2H0UMB1_9BACT|nr:MAG: stress protein [Candidatus Harrisonbacteria bacterium CG10_big_fil_rev_8_21_14_0_10_45_28]